MLNVFRNLKDYDIGDGNIFNQGTFCPPKCEPFSSTLPIASVLGYKLCLILRCATYSLPLFADDVSRVEDPESKRAKVFLFSYFHPSFVLSVTFYQQKGILIILLRLCDSD